MFLNKLTQVILLLFFLAAVSFQTRSQNIFNINNNWVFADSVHLQFENAPSLVTTPTVSNRTEDMRNEEGNASISDGYGNLLFYAARPYHAGLNTFSLYDVNDNPMPNGQNLVSHESASQGIIIAQDPENCDQYFVFYTSNVAGNGLRYSKVDMNLNGGLGDVIIGQKDILLYTTRSEKVALVQKTNSKYFWVITRRVDPLAGPIDELIAIQLLPGGTFAPPVVSTFPNLSASASTGYMNFRSDDQKMAETFYAPGVANIYDFDATTGSFSNRVNIYSNVTNKPYGICYSPSGTVLYLSFANMGTGNEDIRRYDLATSPGGGIFTDSNIGLSDGFHAIQRSSKQLMYITAGSTQFLHTINSPDSYAAPGITLNSLALNRNCNGGVPNIYYAYQTFPFIPDLMSGSQQICYNTSAVIGGTADSVDAIYSWTGQIDLGGIWSTPSASYLINPNATNPTTIPLTSPVTRFILTLLTECGDTILSDKEFVYLDSLPTPSITGNLSYCQGQTITALTSLAPLAGTINWYSDPGLTTLVGTGTSFTPSGALGTTTYYVVEQESVNMAPQVCTSLTTSVTVTVDPQIPLCYTKEASQWYMPSNIGLNFLCSSPPAILDDAVVPLPSGEGGVSISNVNGQLKFYAFDNTVRNKNHVVMPNGAGMQMDISSSQGGVAVPNPGNPNRYYLFTIRSATAGLYYSEIDTTLNGGLGDVVVATKNTSLLANVGEQITAVENCDGTGTWVIVHDASNMYAYLVTATGIAAPVVSPVPAIPQYVGQMMASPSGRHIAFSVYNGPCHLYTFDNETGEICHKETLTFGGYGCSFSNTGQYLYTNELFNGIYQYDAYATVVNTTATLIGNPFVFGTMGLGPDCKLYIFGLNQTQGTVINSPDSPGLLCDLQASSFPLSNLGDAAQYGTPNYIQSWFKDPTYTDPTIDAEFTFAGSCATMPVNFTNTSFSLSACPKYSWDFGDPSSGINNTSTLTNPNHTFSAPGTYTVSLTIAERCQISTQTYDVTVTQPSITVTGDTMVCINDNIVLTASGGTSYSWTGPSWQMGGVSSSTATLTNPGDPMMGGDNEGWYFVTATTAGCSSTDSVYVTIMQSPDVTIQQTVGSCSTLLTTTLNSSNGPISSYVWTVGGAPPTLGTNSFLTVTPTILTEYMVFYTDSAGCSAGSLTWVSPLPTPPAPVIYTPNAWYCVGDNLTPINSSDGSLWFTDIGLTNQVGIGTSVTPSVIVGTTTYYVVDTTGGCTSQSASVTVEFANCSYPCATNLMPNGNLESFSVCPTGVGQISNATNWGGSFTDYYNCGFYAYPDFTPPFTDPVFGTFYNPQGSGYVGLGLNGNTFVYGGVSNQVHLDSCIEYTIQFRASTPRSENDPTNVLCVYGSDVPDPFSVGCVGAPATQLACLSLPSDIDPTWQLYSLTFTPPADFDYLVFAGGCPAPTFHGGWIMIDDVFLCGNCVNPPVVVSVDEINPETCAGGDGEVGATITSCDNSLTYSWENVANPGTVIATTSTVTALPAGDYELTVTDGNGCISSPQSGTVTSSGTSSNSISYSGGPFCSNLSNVSVNLTGTSGGVYSAPGGLSINGVTGAINPSLSTPGTYIVTYNQGGCNVTTSVTITAAPNATIAYSGGPFCTTSTSATVTQTGTGGGSYTASPSGLSINSGSGTINPSLSTPGTYTVTYTVVASGGCALYTTTASVTINAAPTATIAYSGGPFCSNAGVVSVTQTGTSGGAYSASPAGLSINAVNGTITPSTSTAGTYTVSYTIAASGGCAAVVVTTSVTITAAPNATIAYAGGPFCTTSTSAAVTQTGTGGGSYTASPAGLSINSGSGTINPSLSTPGTYTVTYTVAASGGCALYTTTASVTINAAPTATINYVASPFCSTLTSGIVTLTGASGGVFSCASGLSINASTGEINPSLSTPGSYVVTYTIPASGSCAAVSVTTNVIISSPASAVIDYSDSYCEYEGIVSPALTGSAGGVYTSTDVGLVVDAVSGQLTVSSATPGIYTVVYDIPATGGCPSFQTSDQFEIIAQPSVSALPDQYIEWGDSIQLIAQGGTSYLWIPSSDLTCVTCSNPYASPDQTTDYCVIVTENGCSDTACLRINVEIVCGEIFVPNVFSPNDNNKDDELCLYGAQCLTDFTFRIFNRWGEIVYESSDVTECWDGIYKSEKVTSGVFAYTLAGTTIEGNTIDLKGSITVLK